MTLADILEAAKSQTFHWAPSRKAVVIEAVSQGKLTEADVEKRFGVSAEEFTSWKRRHAKNGVAGLRMTKSPDEKPQPRKVKAPARAEVPDRVLVPERVEDWDCAGDWQARRAIMRQRFG